MTTAYRAPAAKDLVLATPYRVLSEDGNEALMMFSAGPRGEVLVGIAHQPPDLRAMQDGWATIFKTQPDTPQDYTLTEWQNGRRVRTVQIEGEPYNLTEAQPLGEGYVLSCPRCRRESDTEIEKNGRIYDAAGRLAGEIVLGDGIKCMVATRDGNIWVGYSDDGIIGNALGSSAGYFGWDAPLGRSGLVKWSPDGEMLYEYAAPDEAGTIYECYAMTVDAVGDLWCYYYDAFHILCVRENGRVQRWNPGIGNAHTMAVAWPYVALLGNEQEDFLCQLVKLEDHGKTRIVAKFRLNTPQGEPITQGRVAAHGSTIHILHEGQVYRLDVADCVANAP
jgi:hypothetical protein